MNRKRDITIDIVKGIAIISIVLGHAWNQDVFHNDYYSLARRFVYYFHIITFIFCSGYLFKNTTLLLFIKKKIKSIYIPTVVCCTISLLLYPFFYYSGLIDKMSLKSIMIKELKTIILKPDGIFVDALWYVTYMLVTMILFWIIYKIYISLNHNNKVLYILSLLCGFIGSVCIVFNLLSSNIVFRILDHYYLSQALISIPIVTLGFKCRENNYLERIKGKIWIIALAILCSIDIFTNITIGILDKNLNPCFFYIVSFIGLLFVLSLSKDLRKCKLVGKLLSIIGASSFYIMAFHLIVFKLIDLFIGKIIIKNNKNIKAFPISHPDLWMVYTILSIAIIVWINWFAKNKIHLNRSKND